MRPVRQAAAAAVALLALGSAQAHAPGQSFLIIRAADDGRVQLRWDVALADAHTAVGLDTDNDGVEPDEAARGEAALFAYGQQHLAVWGDGRACSLAPQRPLQLASHRDGRHLALRFTARCAAAVQQLTVQARWLVDQDGSHRTLARVELGAGKQSGIFKTGRDTLHFTRQGAPPPDGRWERVMPWVSGALLTLLLSISALLWLGPQRVLSAIRRVRPQKTGR